MNVLEEMEKWELAAQEEVFEPRNRAALGHAKAVVELARMIKTYRWALTGIVNQNILEKKEINPLTLRDMFHLDLPDKGIKT